MTDITELAQREKFEAWWEREYKHLESSKYTDAVPHIKYGFWMAYQAGGAELVEALEKAQQRNGELETYSKTAIEFREAARDENRHLKLELEIAEKRVGELEEAEQKLCAANVTLDARAELAERQLAELESRTVTVKLPDYRHERFWDSRCEEFNPVEYQAACIEMWREEIIAQGIKWEAE
ncbi:TPA: hypothetical protein SLP51_001878 [Klebsiella aerogenes]|nr:hypothetical protein [Klebsiella aerogenes]